MNMLQTLGAYAVEHVVSDIVIVFVLRATGVARTVAKRNLASKNDDALPPVVAHPLATLLHFEIHTNDATHRMRLFLSGSLQDRIV